MPSSSSSASASAASPSWAWPADSPSTSKTTISPAPASSYTASWTIPIGSSSSTTQITGPQGLGIIDGGDTSRNGWNRGSGQTAPARQPRPIRAEGTEDNETRPVAPPLIQIDAARSRSSKTDSISIARGKSPLFLDQNSAAFGRAADSSPSNSLQEATSTPLSALVNRVRTFLPGFFGSAPDDSPSSHYPRSPSLLRPHPTIRHASGASPGGSPRKAWRQAAAVVVALVTVGYLASQHARVYRSAHAVQAYMASLGPLHGNRSLEDPRIAAPPLRNHNAAPTRPEGIVAEKEVARPAHRHPVDHHDDDDALPFIATTGDGDDAEPSGDDEQAGLAAIVEQAKTADDTSALETTGAEEPSDSSAAPLEEQALKQDAQEEAPAVMIKVGKMDGSRNEVVVDETDEAEAKAQQAIERAQKSARKRKAKKKQKDLSQYKRLLPLGATPRRYLFGANFVIADGDDSVGAVSDSERINGMIKIPTKKQLARIFADGHKKYIEEEAGWRSFEWQAPPPHTSLQRFLDKLSPEEISLRGWIQSLHKQPVSRGVGLASSATQPLTARLEVLPTFDRGERTKWTELASQAEQGHAGKCQGSTWLDDYTKMHAEMLAGQQEPKLISYHCEQGMNCGGLGDRLLGMTSAFFFGLITKRAFLAEWQSPVPLDVIFDTPHIDWSYSSFVPERHPVLGEKRLASSAADLDVIHFDRLAVDATFGTVSWTPKRDRPATPGFELRDAAYRSPWIKFYSNRGMVYRSFKYKHLQKSIARLGLDASTAFSCISEYLFKPKPAALDLITQYTSVMALPTVFSVGIHIRTGDQSMKDAEYDRVNTVKRHISFFRCARELGETYARADQRVVFYLVTDSRHLKEDAQRVLGSKLIATDFTPQHVHQKTGHVDGVMSAVVEDYILAKADMLVATQDSGFGKLASFMMAKPNSTVTIFPKYNPDVLGLRSKHSHVSVDCTSPTVFTSFEELSSEWSLG